MATGLEIFGAVGTALQLVELAKVAVEFFSDMATGFKDLDGKVTHIHEELYQFKQSAKFAHHNLAHHRVDDLNLKQDLIRYETTIQHFGRQMQKIHRKKSLFGNTKKWMKLMKSDSEINMLRSQLREHTKEILDKFTAAALVDIKGDTTELKARTTRVEAHTTTITADTAVIKADLSASRRENQEGFQDMRLRYQSSEENLRIVTSRLERLEVQNIETPNLSPVDLDDDDIFELDSPPLSPVTAPARSSSPLAWCSGRLTRNDSTDTMAWCSRSSCYECSIHSNETHNFLPRNSSRRGD